MYNVYSQDIMNAVSLKIVSGGNKVVLLDSNQLPDGWQDDDLGAMINRLRKPRNDRIDTDTASEGSAASSQVRFIL